jgi:hypothetical protein
MTIINFTSEFNYFISSRKTILRSSNWCIIKYNKGYLCNLRLRSDNITFNKLLFLDNSFNIINEKIIIPRKIDINELFVGIEDIRLFEFNNEIHYIGSVYHNNFIKITAGIFDLNEYTLNIIEPKFFTPNTKEKNWCYFNYKNKLSLVYQWNPLYICEIKGNELVLQKQIYNVPEFFKSIRGSTSGIHYNNEIWFLVHLTLTPPHFVRSYIHLLLVFDLNMKFLRYSDIFRFENELREFCLGMLISNDTITFSYSLYITPYSSRMNSFHYASFSY